MEIIIDPKTNCHIIFGNKFKPKSVKDGKSIFLSRKIWEEKNGKISVGLLLCHKCDNPFCININHFFLGTPKENTQI